MAAATILGAGLAGLAAAQRLKRFGIAAVVYERSEYPGGHARSVTRHGFTFDTGPHVSFTSDPEVQQLFARGAGEVREIRLHLLNAFEGRFIEHPVQCHLAGLQRDLVVACILDLAAARGRPRSRSRDYDSWCRYAFGDTFAETFAFPYTRKYWTVEPHVLTTDWIGSRIYVPTLKDVIGGALGTQEGDFHYLSTVRYPATGGFQSFLRSLVAESVMHLKREVVAIDPKLKTLEFGSGRPEFYQTLISTLPLPTLIAAIRRDRVPRHVQQAAAQLFWSSVVLVDVGTHHVALNDAHIVYVYDRERACSRIHFPHRLSADNAPPGLAAIQGEVYYSKTTPLPCSVENVAERVLEDMVRLGIIAGDEAPIFASTRDIPFANVVFTAERRSAVRTVRQWLSRHDIEVAGRYGEWDYFWTDDAVRSGWRAADALARKVGLLPE